jgi:hypothetical protein
VRPKRGFAALTTPSERSSSLPTAAHGHMREARLSGFLARSAQHFARSSPLGEPATALFVAEDDGVLPRVEHELEVAPHDRLLRPPAVDYTPLLAHERDRLSVHQMRNSRRVRLDQGGPRRIQSSRGTSAGEPMVPPRAPSFGSYGTNLVFFGYSSFGTNSARASGIRDHGATSTTVFTEPEPVLARTWRRPSLRRVSSSAPRALRDSAPDDIASSSC